MTTDDYALTWHELMVDPYSGFGRIREQAPIVQGSWDGRPVWIVTRHEDVSALLMDRRLATNSSAVPGCPDDYHAALRAIGVAEELVPYLAGDLVRTDPESHARLRKLLSRAFTARRVARLRPRVEDIARELLDALPGRADGGAVELIEHFAHPLPITVICELLGVPEKDRPLWRGWSDDYVSMDPARLNRMLADMSAHLRELVGRRRAEPADDLVSALIRTHDDDGGLLSHTELVAMVLTLMIASQLPTPQLVANGAVALAARPDQLALLRADPGLWPGAVHELVRLCGPGIVAMLRYAAEDIAFGDTVIKQGDRVQLVLGSANRDPRRFPAPDLLDVTRPVDGGVQHLGYSRGAHYCLGAGLANQEIEVALSALFGRYPDLALAVAPEELEWRPIPLTRQLVRVPVVLGEPA